MKEFGKYSRTSLDTHRVAGRIMNRCGLLLGFLRRTQPAELRQAAVEYARADIVTLFKALTDADPELREHLR